MGVKEDKPNTPKKPFIYYYTIMMVVLMALNLFLMPMYRSSQVTEVPYSTFLDMVDQGVVTSVERSDDEIVFLVKTGNKTVFGDDEIAQYKTGPWPDNNLEDTLRSHKVQFTTPIIEQPSALMTILVQWVVPILLFVAVGQFMGKQLQKRMGGPNAMTFGKSNAKIYAESETGKTFADVAGEEEAEDAVTLTSKYTDTYWTQLYFKFPNYIYIQVVPDLLLTKIMVNEDDVTLKLSNSGEQVEQYYVYASGVQKAVYTNLTEAIARAYEERGNVIDSKENILWKCIYADYAQVAGMDNVIKTGTDSTSLAGCLSMIAAVNGKEVTPNSINIEKDSIEELMKKYSGHTTRNLTGCTVDEILYYVSQGSPVLAKISGSRYVIVMSYNATKIRYLDPVTGQSTAVSRTEVTNRLEKTGKVFYSYLIH